MTSSDTLERGTLRQSATAAAPPGPSAAKVSSQSPGRLSGKALLTFAEAGEVLGVSERKAHDVVPTLVTPVVLGPRCVRIVRSELEAAVANLPRRVAPTEPHQLLRGKVERLKRTSGAQAIA